LHTAIEAPDALATPQNDAWTGLKGARDGDLADLNPFASLLFDAALPREFRSTRVQPRGDAHLPCGRIGASAFPVPHASSGEAPLNALLHVAIASRARSAIGSLGCGRPERCSRQKEKDREMAKILKSATWVALGLACSFATAQAADQNKDSQKGDKDQQHAAKDHAQGQSQTITGTVAGVTSVGEAVIDPETNTAIIAEVDYLTVLGSSSGQGQNAHHASADASASSGSNSDKTAKNDSSDAHSGANASKKQNVFLVAINPDTKFKDQTGSSASGASSQSGSQDQNKDQDKNEDQDKNKHNSDQANSDAASRQAFEKLEIGDRVRIEFVSTGRMNGKSHGDAHAREASNDNDKNAGDQQASNKSDDSVTRTAGFRGDTSAASSGRHRHGRHRIMVGEAKSIAILSTPESSANSDSSSSSNSSSSDQDPSQNRNRDSDSSSDKSK
jgi:hypothetical protein